MQNVECRMEGLKARGAGYQEKKEGQIYFTSHF